MTGWIEHLIAFSATLAIPPDSMPPGKVLPAAVAASTGGASPALARRLREELTAFLSEEYAPLAELLREVRRELRQRNLSIDAEAWQRAIDARLRALLAQGRHDEARRHLLARLGGGEALATARPEK